MSPLPACHRSRPSSSRVRHGFVRPPQHSDKNRQSGTENAANTTPQSTDEKSK